jgi:hypothetical protein
LLPFAPGQVSTLSNQPLMSALGHKRTFAMLQPMSALHPKADICGAARDVRFGPIADIANLFDYFVGAAEQGLGDRQAERLCGLQVDGEFVLTRGLHRQISRFLAP